MDFQLNLYVINMHLYTVTVSVIKNGTLQKCNNQYYIDSIKTTKKKRVYRKRQMYKIMKNDDYIKHNCIFMQYNKWISICSIINGFHRNIMAGCYDHTKKNCTTHKRMTIINDGVMDEAESFTTEILESTCTRPPVIKKNT